MVTTRLEPLPTELFDVAYQDIVDRVERRSRGPVRRGLAAVRADLLEEGPVADVVSRLFSDDLSPALLYRDMSSLLIDLDLPIDPIRDYLERSGKSVMRISGRTVAKRVEAYAESRPDSDAGRRDVIFDENDPYLAEEVMRGSRMYWDMYTRDSIRAIKDEIESAYLDDEADAGTIARRVGLVAGLSPRQASALRRMRRTLQSGPLPARDQERQLVAYSEKLADDRAKMTARTELNRVANASVISYWSQMMNRGSLDRNTVVLQWNTRYDERTCSICGPLDGVTTAIHGSFTPSITAPPAHPNCRCSLKAVDLGFS